MKRATDMQSVMNGGQTLRTLFLTKKYFYCRHLSKSIILKGNDFQYASIGANNDLAPSRPPFHYLNQYWSRLLTHMCVVIYQQM